MRFSLRCATAMSVLAFCAGAFGADMLSIGARELAHDYPGVGFCTSAERVTRIYGTPFGFGDSPEQVARAFVLEHADVFGVAAGDLAPYGPVADGRHTQPVMYERDRGEYKFTLVSFTQTSGGIPVFRAHLRLLVRNEPAYPLVLAASSLRDLGGFTATVGVIDEEAGKDAALKLVPSLLNFTNAELVIWAGVDDVAVAPAVAVVFIADNGMPATAEYEKWLFVAHATSGEILHQEDMIVSTDVVGNVSGMATQGVGADICEPEDLEAMPYAYVNIVGGSSTYADEYGDFVIPNAGDTPVTVQSPVRGRYFHVYNQGGADTVLEQTITPPGPADFVHNEANSSEFQRAEVNSYVEANVVRDFVLTCNPDYPVIANQTNFTVNVNINSTCNAYYDGSSINFYRAGGGCSNTANTTVVHHEYGHHVVAMGGSGQGAYGEGIADSMGVLITDTSRLGIGFRNDCDSGLRDADNDMQYPCSGEIHYCGQLLSGCVWSTRTELLATHPDDYLDIISTLTVNSVLLHSGTSIDPSITIDFLTLDDDDGDMGNGTPHFAEIFEGFDAHNMIPRLLNFEYPDGHPLRIEPTGATSVRVVVSPNILGPLPGSGRFFYDAGEGFDEGTMNEVLENVYDAVFPAVPCGQSVRYYFSAETLGGQTETDPQDAPDSTFLTYSAYDLVMKFADDFETDQGWSVSGDAATGHWERGVPVGGGVRGDPPTDYDGSGKCYLTQNAYGDSDVDDGYTYLDSPTIDLSDGDAIVYYALWYTNDHGNDPNNDLFKTYVSNDDGDNWVVAEVIGPVTPAYDWIEHAFQVGAFVDPTAFVKIRFEASDLNDGSVVEAGIDAFSVSALDCEAPCVGDLDGDGDTDQQDLGILLASYGVDDGGDLDGDGNTDQQDLAILLSDWACGIP
jgi:hypothetical protein